MYREVVDALGLVRLSSPAHFSVKTRVAKLEGGGGGAGGQAGEGSGGGGYLLDASAKFDLALRILEELGGVRAVQTDEGDAMAVDGEGQGQGKEDGKGGGKGEGGEGRVKEGGGNTKASSAPPMPLGHPSLNRYKELRREFTVTGGK